MQNVKKMTETILGVQAVSRHCFEKENGRIEALAGELTLSSNFQPIYSLSHHKPIGYEGLLRIHDRFAKPINPEHFFRSITGERDKVEIDRLSRYLHMRNFVSAGGGEEWLFLNLHPDVILQGPKYGAFFADCIEQSGISAENIVVEILENSINDRGLLSAAVQYYRNIGCKIAIDDFGAVASNIDRLWQLEPDIVKLDRQIAVEMTKPLVRRLLPGLVSMIHECGSLVLLEGVETEEQTLMAIDAGVDFVQGYFFARPAKELRCSAENKDENDIALFPGLCGKYRQYIHDSQARHKKRLEQYTYDFDIAAREHAFNGSPDVFSDILSKSGVERFYVLDRDGSQVGETLYPDGHEMTYKTRFGYVGNGEGSTWFRRHYFRRAIAEPGKLHNSRPYLSMTGGIICKTLSLCLTTTEGDIRVYCCDIDWTEG